MAYYPRKHWTSTKNQAVDVKQKQRHVTLHYPGFGNSSVKTADWDLERCFQQLRAWRNMHVGSGAYREVAYNLYALPTGDVAEGRGNRQNGANGFQAANRAGMSVQVLVGDNEPLTEGHIRAILAAFALLESWHPGITQVQHPHNHWVGTRCPGPKVEAAMPFGVGSRPVAVDGSGSVKPPVRDQLRPWRTSPRVRGYTAAEVREIQKVVGVTVDGKYGDQTGAAVRSLQERLSLAADGVWGPKTEDTVNSIEKKIDRAIAIATQNQKEIRATPARVLDAEVDLEGAWKGQKSTLRRMRAWYAEDLRQIKALCGQVLTAQAKSTAEVLKAIEETAREQGLSDEQVAKIASAAAEAAARVSAEDVAEQLEVTVTKGD